MKLRYPISQPKLNRNELNLITRAVKSTWISSTGEYIEEFEAKFAQTVGSKYTITASNGTTALHLALLALGIGPGDEVIVPTLTFVASANSVVYTGAKPVFVDIDEPTWTIDPQKIEKKITRSTRAVMPVHLYGYPARMDEILRITRKYKLKVIEDAAEAHGARINNEYVGTMGDIGCFSFYGNKIITTGEGGMITTNNKKLAEKIRLLKNHGMSTQKKYWHPVIGYNYRMTNLQCAIGLAQLNKLQTFLETRKQIAQWYRTNLRKIPGIILPPENTSVYRGVNWLFTILVEDISLMRNFLRKMP